MWSVRPWQRLCHCPLWSNSWRFYKETLSDLEPAYAVIVRYPCTPAPHGPPDTGKRKINQAFKEKKRKERKQRSPRPLLLHFHGHLSGPILLRPSNLRLTLLLLLGGCGSLLEYLAPLALFLLPWGWLTPPPSLHRCFPLSRASIHLHPIRSSTVGTFYHYMRELMASSHFVPFERAPVVCHFMFT